MEQNYFLSLDLGTQGTKAALIDINGNVAACAFAENIFSENDGGAIILPAEALRDGAAEVTKAVLNQGVARPEEIIGVGVVGMMAGIVGLDENWVPLTHYDSGLDKRCETAIHKMQEMGEEKVISLCGSPIIVAQGAKMYWWKENYPELFAQNSKICSGFYLYLRMHGWIKSRGSLY